MKERLDVQKIVKDGSGIRNIISYMYSMCSKHLAFRITETALTNNKNSDTFQMSG